MGCANVAVRTTVSVLVLGLMTVPVLAEDATSGYAGATSEDVGVMERARPAYDAKGIPLGAFRLFPSLDVNSSYDDNVFRTDTAVSDWFFVVAPTVRLKSQWGRHFVEMYGGVNDYNYTTYTAENLTDWRIGTDGRVDVSRAANITANVFYSQDHELWSAPNNQQGYQAAPNRYFQVHSDAVATYQPNRLGFQLGGAFDRYIWRPTPAVGGGTLYNSDRDENEFQAFLKSYYDFSPGYSAYIKGSYDERDFDQFYDRSGLHRSSHGYRIDGGVNLQISHLVAGEIFVGYLQQNFSSADLKDVSGFDYGAQLDWFLSPVLTAHLSGKRTLDNVILAGVSVADNKGVTLSADYEFRPNIILQARGGYTATKYAGSTRTDDYPSAGVGIKYLVNSYASLNVDYNYSERSTDTAGLQYTDNMLSIGLTLHI